jgi:hypothetical protein
MSERNLWVYNAVNFSTGLTKCARLLPMGAISFKCGAEVDVL